MPSPRSTGGRRTPRGPHAPRVTAPDLPARFDGDADLAPRAGDAAVSGYNASGLKHAGRLADLPGAAAPRSFLLMEDAPAR